MSGSTRFDHKIKLEMGRLVYHPGSQTWNPKKVVSNWGKNAPMPCRRSCHLSFDDSGYVASRYEESFADRSIVMTKSFANTIPAQACQTLQRDAKVIYGRF